MSKNSDDTSSVVQRRRSPRLAKRASVTSANGPSTSPPADAATPWKRKLLIRCVAGLAMIFSFYGLSYASPWGPVGIVWTVQLFSFQELMRVRYARVGGLSWVCFLLAQWLSHGARVLGSLEALRFLLPYHLLVFFIGCIACLIAVVVMLERGGDYEPQIVKLAWLGFSLLLTVGQGAGSLYTIFEGGIVWFMLPISVIVCNDIMALFCGLAFGGKLTSRQFLALSPKKTWEGYLCAIPMTILFSFIFVYFYAQVDYWICPLSSLDESFHCVRRITDDQLYLHGLVFALFASIVGPFAGFLASAIKRAHNKKDFASMIPGHGGMYDRMDVNFLGQLFAYVYLRTFLI